MSKANGAVTLLMAAMVAGSAGVALAQADEESPAHKAVDYRTSYMTILGWNAKPMGRMLKGETDFDADAFMHHARDLANAARLDLLGGFPEGSVTDDSAAKEEIWFAWDDFKEKFGDFQASANALGEAAAGGGLEATKAAYGKVGDACKACHKEYKE